MPPRLRPRTDVKARTNIHSVNLPRGAKSNALDRFDSTLWMVLDRGLQLRSFHVARLVAWTASYTTALKDGDI